MSRQLATMVETQCVVAQQPAHTGHQVGIGRLHNQMKMVSHQAIGMHLETSLLASLGQGFEEILAVHIIVINLLATITATHQVVDCPSIFNSHHPPHDNETAKHPPGMSNR